MTFAMNQYSDALVVQPDGVWATPSTKGVSYPDDGHDIFFRIEQGSFWFRHRNACIHQAIKKFPPAGPLFDVGGGNGFVSLYLEKQGIPVAVVEAGASGVANCRRRGLPTVIHGTMEQAAFFDESLPAVGLFDVLEHQEDDIGFLAQLGRALVPGGRVYLTVPAGNWLWSHEDVSAGHYRRYSQQSLALAVGRAGLELEYITSFFSVLSLPIAILRALPYRLGLKVRQDDSSTANQEHQAFGSPLRSGLDAILSLERRWMAAGKRLNCGSSLLAVARKKKPNSAGIGRDRGTE
jgi:SAM-dependent methyltransferase